jgi:CheY-like chemotaxis protein
MGKSRILVIEDESIVALNIKKQLEIDGYEVPGVFATGEEAIAAFPEINPDLVIMDILLKGEIDGIQSAELLRTKYNVPVVLLTALR